MFNLENKKKCKYIFLTEPRQFCLVHFIDFIIPKYLMFIVKADTDT